jgi:hypothetical protein
MGIRKSGNVQKVISRKTWIRDLGVAESKVYFKNTVSVWTE